ncbi:MAG TPA: hypothetical protein VIO94_05615 [Phenylobacterium sp.]
MGRLAYSLSQSESGWRWSVYDEDGLTVAAGAAGTQDRALAAVDMTLRVAAQNAMRLMSSSVAQAS